MPWPRRRPIPEPDEPTLLHSDTATALDQAAGWVRFADTKATILAGALGVSATAFTGSWTSVYSALSSSCAAGLIIGVLLVATAIAFIVTMISLLVAIRPSFRGTSELNRFAWPSLARTDLTSVTLHRATTTAENDAWSQVLDLTRVADKKYRATRTAVTSFAAFLGFAIACSGAAAAMTA